MTPSFGDEQRMVPTPPAQRTGSNSEAPMEDFEVTSYGKHMRKTKAKFCLDTCSRQNFNSRQPTKKRMASSRALRIGCDAPLETGLHLSYYAHSPKQHGAKFYSRSTLMYN